MENEKIESMGLFALDAEVAHCEAALPSLRDEARLSMLVLLSWHLRQRQTTRAIALCAEAAALLARVTLPEHERLCISARLLLVQAEEKWLLSRLYKAEAAAREALEAFTTLGNAIGCVDAHWLLAFVAYERGDHVLSVAALNNAAQACSTCGDAVRSAAVQVALSYLTAFLERPAQGRHLAVRVDILAPPDSHQGLVALANSFQIRLYFRSGDFANAIIRGKLALGAALATGQIKLAIIASVHIGAAFYKLNNVEGAQAWMQSALKLARATGWPIHYLQHAFDIAIAGDGLASPHDGRDSGAQECATVDIDARMHAESARDRSAAGPALDGAAGRDTRFDHRNRSAAQEARREQRHGGELTRFLASASHDMRQPLHALNLYLSALSNVNLPEPAVTLLTNVRKCADVVDAMFLGLLDLSRLDTQAVRPQVERFPVGSLLTRIALEFSTQATSKGLELRMAPCSAWVQCDPALVEQILRNFAANAIRYTASGKILIGCRRRGDRLRIAVYDTGIGISPHQQETLFDGLNRVDSKRRDGSEGVGLGMAIVQRLGRLLSTPVMLASTPGRGSMFAIDLPILPDHPVGARPARSLSAVPAEILKLKLVVVVDDDDAVREATRILLEQWGCVVVAASSGADAVSKLGMSPCPPDALICDYRLSRNECGLDVIRGLQNEFNQEIPALLVTGDAVPESIPGLSPESLPVLHKPVHANILRDALIRLLSGRSQTTMMCL